MKRLDERFFSITIDRKSDEMEEELSSALLCCDAIVSDVRNERSGTEMWRDRDDVFTYA